MLGRSIVLCVVAACGDNITKITPESVAANAKDGDHVEVIGEVHTVTFDSTQVSQRRAEVAAHEANLIEWLTDDDAEERRGEHFAYDDTNAQYPRTPDHYILIRSTKPPGVTFGDPDFAPGHVLEAWGLGVHLTDLDPAVPMPEVGASIKVSGTFHRIAWNQRTDVMMPILDGATIEVLSAPPELAGPGVSCALDQACNARLICDRTSHTCGAPPREIYWADPWHDVNGACDTDADCPLGQVCDPSYSMTGAGMFAAHYFPAVDVGRHLCRLAPNATVAAECPRIYTIRDVIGGRFVSGKEICVRGTLLLATVATDNDTHDQLRVDEPIPYPQTDIAYNLFGGVTENSPPYKDPALPGGPIVDPQEGQDVIAIGTFRYDPDHGWYEVHPVKAYLAP